MYKKSSKDVFKVLPSIISAYQNGKMRVSAVDLQKQHNVNCRTLNVNLQKLVKAGIFNSQIGGNNPGYGFLLDPKSVSLYDITQVICPLDYPQCTINEETTEEVCVVCDITRSAIDLVVKELKGVSCYDFYMSLPKKYIIVR